MEEKYTSSYAYKVRSGWRIGVKYRDPETGLWKDRTRKSTSTRKTEARRDAENWRKELNERELERSEEGDCLTVARYVRSYIDNKVASGVVSKKTAYNYEQAIKVIKDPSGGIASIPVDELTPTQIREWLSWMMGENRGLSPATAKHYYDLLKMAMNQALVDRVIDWNPLIGVKAPKLPKYVPNSLDSRSIATLVRWIADSGPTNIRTAVALALYGGMRRGECCALTWANVDQARGAILVAQSAPSSNKGDLQPAKSGKRRIVPVSPALGIVLRERYQWMLDRMALVHESEAEWEIERRLASCFVCGDIDGSIYDPHRASDVFRAVVSEIELTGIHSSHITFHTLRHTFATRMIGEGVDVKTVSSILGHASARMTLDVYAAADPEAIAAAAPRIDRALSVSEAENQDEPAYILPAGS